MFKPFATFPKIAQAVMLSAFLALGSLSAAPADSPPDLSDKISEEVVKLGPIFDAKKWDEGIAMIDDLISKVEPGSFDVAFLNQLKAQAMANKGDNAGMTKALEASLKIADSLGLFRFPKLLPISEQDTLTYLSTLYVQEAQTPGKSIDFQRDAYTKAYAYSRRLIDHASSVKPEQQALAAQILFYQATLDPANVDTTLIKRAMEEVDKALMLTINPKDDIYVLKLALYQHMGDNAKAAEILELLVKKNPNNKSLWPILFNSYLAQQGRDLAAIVTLERAQAMGLMNTPKENFTLAGLYYNIQQFERAADLLEKGLRSGAIEPEQKNWELLADTYQRMGREDKAIDTFKRASKLFPKVGNFDLQIGQIYYNRDNPEQALTYMRSAVKKGLEKNQLSQTYYFIAFMTLEMRRLDDALEAAHKAVEADPKSQSAQDLLNAIENSIEERKAFTNSRA